MLIVRHFALKVDLKTLVLRSRVLEALHSKHLVFFKPKGANNGLKHISDEINEPETYLKQTIYIQLQKFWEHQDCIVFLK